MSVLIEENNLIFGSGQNQLVIRVINDRTINVRARRAFDTLVTKKLQPEKTLFDVSEDDQFYTVQTSCLKIKIQKADHQVSFLDLNNRVINQDHAKNLIKEHPSYCYKELKENELFFGLGERTGFVNKRGMRYRFWNYAEPDHFDPISNEMYQSIPFLIGKTENHVFGIYHDNSFDSFFDLGKESDEYYYFGADGGELNYYFFFGDSIRRVIELYTNVTGRPPLPPMWSLGYHQSRWGYYPQQTVSELAKTFRAKNIPCDSIHLDIDYMDNYKVFTFDKEKFPDPKGMIDELNNQGFKLITIVDPGVKIEKGYKVYEEGAERKYFIKESGGDMFAGDVWPGGCGFPDFTKQEVRTWWAGLNKEFLELGVKGIWNDLNEPSILTKPHTLPKDLLHETEEGIKTHGQIHNLYANYEAMATLEGWNSFDSETRPFILSRAGFAGIQKYAAVWTGDNQSSWDQLLLSIPMFITLGLSGVPFVGADVGGYAGDCPEELLVRWMQLGAFSPLYRNHSRKLTPQQEPWAFSERSTEIITEFIRLRYRLLPYFYNCFRESHEKGYPVFRPMFFNFEEDAHTHLLSDQFMVGGDLLVAPMYLPGQNYRSVYLPKGTWYDFWSGEPYEGGKHLVVRADIDKIPVFVKGGSIIPEYPVMNYVGEKEIKEVTLHVYPGEGEFVHYDDDGQSNRYTSGEYNKTLMKITKDQDGLRIRSELKHNEYKSLVASYRFVIHGVKTVSNVLLDNQNLHFTLREDGVEFVTPTAELNLFVEELKER